MNHVNQARINTISTAWQIKLIDLPSATAAINRLMPRCHIHPETAAFATDAQRRPICAVCVGTEEATDDR